MPTYTTACPRNCYSTCSMLVTVEKGRILRIEAHPDNLATNAGICLKGLSYVEREHSPHRIVTPLVRITTGDFVPASWDEVLDRISNELLRIRENYGPKAVLYYTGSGSKGWLNRIGARFWRLFGGYTGTFGDLCWPAGLEASRLTLGDNKHNHPWDIVNSRLIILWGKNPAETNIHQVGLIDQALAQGSRLIVIDPRRTLSAHRADLHIQPRPGTDGALALGVAHLLEKKGWVDHKFVSNHVHGYEAFRTMLLEYPPDVVANICDISQGDLYQLAEAIGTIHPAIINVGYGMQRYSNGGQTVRAIISLVGLTGNVGKIGGGFAYANLQSFVFDIEKDPISLYPKNQSDTIERISISIAKLGSDILETTNPPLKGIWIERGNPVTQNPETPTVLRALRSMDFRVVIDEFMTDTAREADVILPAKTFLEQSDVITAYWHPYIQHRQKVLDPPGEVIPETEVYWLLGQRLGYSPEELRNAGIPAPGESDTLIEQAISEVNQRFSADTPVEIKKLSERPLIAPGTQSIAFEDMIFATPSGKIELYSEEAAEKWNVDPLPRWRPPIESSIDIHASKQEKINVNEIRKFSLQLLTPNTKNSIHSQFHNLKTIQQFDKTMNSRPKLSINPVDAAERHIDAGDMVRIFNDRGELFLAAALDHGIRPGCVSCPNGYWVQNGGGINILSKGRETDMGHGAAFHDNLVEVEKIEPGFVDGKSISGD